MNTESNRWIFWPLAGCMIVAVSNSQSISVTVQPETDSANSISSDPIFDDQGTQINEEIIKDYKQQFVKAKSKLEKTKVAFNEAFNNQNADADTVKVHGLIREADEEGKAWIREALIKRFNLDPDPRVRRACLLCITAFPEAAAREMVAKALSDNDRQVRITAAIVSESYLTENELGALCQAVKEDKAEAHYPRTTAKMAIMAIGLIGGERASTFLKEVWYNEELSRYIRVETLFALGCSSDPCNFYILESVLNGEDESIRGNAAFGLNNIALLNAPQIQIRSNINVTKNPQMFNKAINLLRSKINDDNTSVRCVVTDCLGVLGNSKDIDLLAPLLDDKHSEVIKFTENGEIKEKVVYPIREKAREAIEKINNRFPPEKRVSTESNTSYSENPFIVDSNEILEPNLPAVRVAPFRTYTLITVGVVIAVAGAAIFLKKKAAGRSK